MLQVGNDLVKATGIWVTGGLGFSTKKVSVTLSIPITSCARSPSCSSEHSLL